MERLRASPGGNILIVLLPPPRKLDSRRPCRSAGRVGGSACRAIKRLAIGALVIAAAILPHRGLACDICRGMARTAEIHDLGAAVGSGSLGTTVCLASTMAAGLDSGSDGLSLSSPRPASALNGFAVNVTSGTGFTANTQAQAAFQRAIDTWESLIASPITINVTVDLLDFGNSSIIGGASSVFLEAGYSTIRNQWVANSPGNPLVASLPTAEQFTENLPAGFSLNGKLLATKANLKAMGFTDLDALFGTRDGTIEFNTGFAFDYDNSNGVTPGTICFESVALHEIGHVLGFVSIVDEIDFLLNSGSTAAVGLMPLDLFRFAAGAAPQTLSSFTTAPRHLLTSSADFGLIDAEYGLSTGVYTGDGRQASHWIDDPLGPQSVGVMDPTIGFGQVFTITQADLQAFSAIGYSVVAVPEPSTWLLACAGLAIAAIRRRAIPGRDQWPANQAAVFARPAASGTVGCQPRSLWAAVASTRLLRRSPGRAGPCSGGLSAAEMP